MLQFSVRRMLTPTTVLLSFFKQLPDYAFQAKDKFFGPNTARKNADSFNVLLNENGLDRD